MNRSAKVRCLFMLLLIRTTGVLPSTCGESIFNETLRRNEYDFVNMSYTINVTRSTNLLDRFHAAYEVCEKNVKKLSCSLRWENSFTSLDRKDKSRTTAAICYGQDRNLSRSEVALTLHISQLVTRSLSVMILSPSKGGISKPRWLIRVEVLYPPNITSMTVDGHEVKDDYVIDEGHKVDIFCAYERGNPPIIFQLLNQHNSVLKSSSNQGHLNYSITARCEDEWPKVKCQGSGSTKNRSVTFLLRCPPQFVDSSVKFVSVQIFEAITFRVKGHTAELIGCLLTPVALGNNIRRGVSCFLSGNPPDLVLSVYLYKETNISQGNWSLILHNEKGSANTTLYIIDGSSPKTTNVEGIKNYQRIDLTHTVEMESSPEIGCIIRNKKDPYQIQCVFSTDPGEKRDYSVYFYSPDGSQDLMVSCTHIERDKCIVLHEGLSVTDDYISVSETFSKQNGSFVCRNGGPALEQFPCFYSGNSVTPEGAIANGSTTSLMPEDFETKYYLAISICAVLGVVIILLSLALCFLLRGKYKSKKERESSKRPTLYAIAPNNFSVENSEKPLHAIENETSNMIQNEIDEKSNIYNKDLVETEKCIQMKGKDKHFDLSHSADKCESNGNNEDNEDFKDTSQDDTETVSLIANECDPGKDNNPSDENQDCAQKLSNRFSSEHEEPREGSKITEREASKRPTQYAIAANTPSVESSEKPLLAIKNTTSDMNQNEIDEKSNIFNRDLVETKKCIQMKGDDTETVSLILNECDPGKDNNPSDENQDCVQKVSNHLSSEHREPREGIKITEREASKRPTPYAIVPNISSVESSEKQLFAIENETSNMIQNEIDEKSNIFNKDLAETKKCIQIKGKDKHFDLSHSADKCESNGNNEDNEDFKDTSQDDTETVSLIANECDPGKDNNPSDENQDCAQKLSNRFSSEHEEPREGSKITAKSTRIVAFVK